MNHTVIVRKYLERFHQEGKLKYLYLFYIIFLVVNIATLPLSVAIFISRSVLILFNLLQLLGNGTMVWILIFRNKLTKSNAFILSLAFSDLLSGLGGIIGIYREDLGRVEYNWPVFTNYVYVIIEFSTTIGG